MQKKNTQACQHQRCTKPALQGKCYCFWHSKVVAQRWSAEVDRRKRELAR